MVLAVIVSYSRCYMRMRPASRLLAHFTALFHFVRILLRLCSPARRPTRMYADGTISRVNTWSCIGLYTLPVFTKKINYKYAKCSLTFYLKNGLVTFYVNITNIYVIVDKRKGCPCLHGILGVTFKWRGQPKNLYL